MLAASARKGAAPNAKKVHPLPRDVKDRSSNFNRVAPKSSKNRAARAGIDKIPGLFDPTIPPPLIRSAILPRVTVYSRQGCHLCDDAVSLLARFGLSPTVVDIDADPALRERYTDCVPVVEIDGRERFRGRVNEVLLRRLLAGRVTP